ncbi:CATRA system-associated protein [Actinomadura sp. WMMB 499]|uniref:CATRA system-associated protein n=1 Tax=Actinomadura sp. WMMB 499 TaxID=1219491 RepID=UPI0012494611|nr:CATRA system-associated protein [Actinomadura sp. WMMB 499]QFG24613.1 hypothetical protein F7P10_29210 [Actinomadura sp. WMMB 499]
MPSTAGPRRARRKADMVLREVPGRELPADAWPRVAELVEALGRALGGPDPDAVLRAAAGLAAASAPRVTRIRGGDPPVPCPPAVRERVNVLVHELSRWDEAPAVPGADGGAGPGFAPGGARER